MKIYPSRSLASVVASIDAGFCQQKLVQGLVKSLFLALSAVNACHISVPIYFSGLAIWQVSLAALLLLQAPTAAPLSAPIRTVWGNNKQSVQV